ncbi:MAG: hypothetical protein ABIK83_04405 [Candidatus Zixiibacteriota bacterium]
MLRRTALLLVLITISISSSLHAQSKDNSPEWKALQFLIGQWEGVEYGKSDTGTGVRSYSPVLDQRFLYVRNVSRMGSEKDSLGEGKEDWSFFSWDKYREKVIFRQFQEQGFVYYYVLDSMSADRKTMTFTTERIENVPNGWVARTTFIFNDNDHFTETFELSPAMMAFDKYLEKHWTRKKFEGDNVTN